MTHRIYALAALIALLTPAFLEAQTTGLTPADEQPHALVMSARPTGAGIKLRWAPTSAIAWRHCNSAGYVVARYTLMRDKRLLPWEERSVPTFLSQEPIRPWETEAQWKPLMQRNNYAAIAAQALMGKSFVVTTGTENDGENAQLVNRAREETNRYTFGLFAADHSYETAIAMGLAIEDRNIRDNETYLYRVYPYQQPIRPMDTLHSEGRSIPIDLRMAIDTGFISTGLADYFQLPKVRELEAIFGNRMATLSWNKDLFNQFYVSYKIERSEDGVSWQSLHDLPYASPEQPGNNSPYMFMIDSLAMNNKPYFYRVMGRTPFDEFGPPSDPVQGMGIDPLPQFFPYIVGLVQNEQGGFEVGWEFKASDEDKIAGFRILRAPKDQGPFTVLSGNTLLPPSQRNFRDDSPLPTNYYRVVALDAYNREMSSYSALAQINDETPPAAPRNVRGTVLKNGTMVLTWDTNTEADLLGYRVYIANNPRHEFTQITSRPAPKNHFIDTVSLKTLSREIYVQVLAVDYRENRSAFSEMAVVLRPDTIAPAAPVFKDLTATAEGVVLHWANSKSKDVVRHELQRRADNDDGWKTIAKFPFEANLTIESYTDSTATVGIDYHYQVVAFDNSDLHAPSPTVEARRLDDFVRPVVTNVEAVADRRNKYVELSWAYPDMENVKLFQVYRGVKDETPKRYKGLEPNAVVVKEDNGNTRKKRSGFAFFFRDEDLRMNTSYTYRVRAVYRDGGLSPLSEPIKIDY